MAKRPWKLAGSARGSRTLPVGTKKKSVNQRVAELAKAKRKNLGVDAAKRALRRANAERRGNEPRD
jgi:hypothetical protein